MHGEGEQAFTFYESPLTPNPILYETLDWPIQKAYGKYENRNAFLMLRVATGISIHCPEETGHRFNRPSESYSSLPLSLTRERTFKVFFSHQIPGGFAGRFAFCVVSRLDLLCHCNSEGLPRFPAHLRGCPVPSGIRWGL